MIKQLFKNIKLIILGVLVGILGLFGFNLYRDYKKLQRDRITAPVLTEDEKEKIVIDDDGTIRHIIRDGDGNQIVDETDGARDTVITVDPDGDVKVWYKTKGLGLEPGVTAFMSDGLLHVGVDVQWAYWKRWGVGSGMGLAVNRDYKFGIYTGVYYNFWSNTSIHVGVNDRLHFVGGIRIKF